MPPTNKEADAFTQRLIQRGAELAAAQDKAFMAKDRDREIEHMAAKDATAWALGAYLGIEKWEAMEMILAALDEVTGA